MQSALCILACNCSTTLMTPLSCKRPEVPSKLKNFSWYIVSVYSLRSNPFIYCSQVGQRMVRTHTVFPDTLSYMSLHMDSCMGSHCSPQLWACQNTAAKLKRLAVDADSAVPARGGLQQGRADWVHAAAARGGHERGGASSNRGGLQAGQRGWLLYPL